jgi:hypothetical protein
MRRLPLEAAHLPGNGRLEHRGGCRNERIAKRARVRKTHFPAVQRLAHEVARKLQRNDVRSLAPVDGVLLMARNNEDVARAQVLNEPGSRLDCRVTPYWAPANGMHSWMAS